MRLKLWLVVIIVLVVAFSATAITASVVNNKYLQGKDKVQLYVENPTPSVGNGAAGMYVKLEDYKKSKSS